VRTERKKGKRAEGRKGRRKSYGNENNIMLGLCVGGKQKKRGKFVEGGGFSKTKSVRLLMERGVRGGKRGTGHMEKGLIFLTSQNLEIKNSPTGSTMRLHGHGPPTGQKFLYEKTQCWKLAAKGTSERKKI